MAYHFENEPPISWERQARDAAVRAVALEPENDGALALVKNRSARLHKLEAK